MIDSHNLPKVLGDAYIEGAEYAMAEAHASGRAGMVPSPRRNQPGHWKPLGQFSDPDLASTRQFYIYRWDPIPTIPPSSPKES